MVEALGIAASAFQIADLAFSIAKTLRQYVKNVQNATEEIKELASEVRLTSGVLKQINEHFSSETTAAEYSQDALVDASAAVERCNRALKSIVDAVMFGCTIDDSGMLNVGTTVKLRWPSKKDKIEAIRGNLERAKSMLTLIMTTLLHSLSRRNGDKTNALLQKIYMQTLRQQLDSNSTKTKVSPGDSASTTDKGIPTVDNGDPWHSTAYKPSQSEITASFLQTSRSAAAFTASAAVAALNWHNGRTCVLNNLNEDFTGVAKSFADLSVTCGKYNAEDEEPKNSLCSYSGNKTEGWSRPRIERQCEGASDSAVGSSVDSDDEDDEDLINLPSGRNMANGLLRRWIADWE